MIFIHPAPHLIHYFSSCLEKSDRLGQRRHPVSNIFCQCSRLITDILSVGKRSFIFKKVIHSGVSLSRFGAKIKKDPAVRLKGIS